MINNYFQDQEYHSSNQVYCHPTYHHSIYIGDMSSAQDFQFMNKHHIRTVITAAAGMEHLQFQPDSLIKHIVYPLLDTKSQNIGKFFNPVHQLFQVQLASGSVLVHCAAGISRSATLVIAYLMKHKNWTFKEAISFVRKSRPKVCPNLGFERQLKEYERFLSKKSSQNIPRRAPKTSEESKHSGGNKPKNIQLPQIGVLGRTQIKSIVLNPFSQKITTRASQRGGIKQRSRKQEDESPYKLKPLKMVRKTKSLLERQQQREEVKIERSRQLDNLKIGNNSFFLKKVNMGESQTERIIRRRPILRFQQLHNPI